MKRATLLAAGLAMLAVGVPMTVNAAEGPAASAEVKAAYKKHCRKCHGWDGKAQTKLGRKKKVKDLTANDWLSKTDDARLLALFKEGWKDPENPKRKMPAFAKKLSAEQLQALIPLMKTFVTGPPPFPEETKK